MVWDGSKVFVSVVGKGLRRLAGWGRPTAWPDLLVIGGFQDPEWAELLARVKGC